jgi:hypothetical protein
MELSPSAAKAEECMSTSETQTFDREPGRTADPSTPLRSGRDDKGEGDTSIDRGC